MCEATPNTEVKPPRVMLLSVWLDDTADWHVRLVQLLVHSIAQKAKKSAGANLLIFALLGSPTWARTGDLRINSPTTERAGNSRQCSLSGVLLSDISAKFRPTLPRFRRVQGADIRQLVWPDFG